MEINTILNSGDVVRFHNHSGIDKQKNSEHQWGVALVLEFIYPNCSKELLKAALTHDAHEYFTGDIPFPIKQHSQELKTLLAKLENEWEIRNGVKYDLNWEEHAALKLADVLEGMHYCLSQVKIGNINAKRPFRKWRAFLNEFIKEHSVNAGDNLTNILSKASTLGNRFSTKMEEL
jgi:5'-deoxynucleotidase YfbR-like HD superfamily hydrolase